MNRLVSSHFPEIKTSLTHTIRMMCFAILTSSPASGETHLSPALTKIIETTPIKTLTLLGAEMSGPEISKKFE